jgi:AraC-like DNA-binding protein
VSDANRIKTPKRPFFWSDKVTTGFDVGTSNRSGWGEHLKFEFQHFDEAAQTLPGLNLDYVQIDSGPQKIAFDIYPLEGGSLTHTSIRKRVAGWGDIKPGRLLALLFLDSGEPHLYDGYSLSQGDLGFRTDVGIDGGGLQVLQTGYQSWLLDLPQEPFIKLLDGHPKTLWGLRRVCRGESYDWRSLNRYLWNLARLSEVEKIPDRRILNGLIERLVQVASSAKVVRVPASRRSRYKKARLARDMIHHDPLVDKAEICGKLEVSLRTLQRLFVEFMGAAPTNYAQILSLERARDELLFRSYERGVVSKVAGKHGFWHLGRFSVFYKRVFGETPVETLKRRKNFARSNGIPRTFWERLNGQAGYKDRL